MAETTISTSHAITVEQFQDSVFEEYLSKLVLAKYMGVDDPNAMIHVNEDLRAGEGDAVTFNFGDALSGSGVEGEGTLEGNEEALAFDGQRVLLNQYSHATKDSGALTRKRSPFDILSHFKPQLTNWLAQKTEKLAFLQMHAINGVLYASASEGQKDAWLAANADRVLFGSLKSNNAANDHSASLLNIDATDDNFDTEMIEFLKLEAELMDPLIRPIRIEGGEEVYVILVNPLQLRSLKKDPRWVEANIHGMPRGLDNPIFTGAAGIWESCIIKSSPRVPILSAVGAGGINVSPGFFCGAQALFYAQGGYENGEKVLQVEKKFDYNRKYGSAIMSLFEINKAVKGTKDHGIFTFYTASVGN